MDKVNRGRVWSVAMIAMLLLLTAWFPGFLNAQGYGGYGGGSQGGINPAPARTRCTIPADRASIFAFLKDGSYRYWHQDPAAHTSSGPHGEIKVYVNSVLERSLMLEEQLHPVCSSAVIEMYNNDTLTGWWAQVKTGEGTNVGDNWYWYSNMDTADGENPDVADYGVRDCTACHTSGTDMVKVSWPLSGTHEVGVPTNKDEMFTWLQSGLYLDWGHESYVHASTGPHGEVKVFVNPTLEHGMMESADVLHTGSVSVKELYDGEDLMGWAVMVKTQEDSADGEGWYWYQIKSVTDGENPDVAMSGATGCAQCHANGADYVFTSYPLM